MMKLTAKLFATWVMALVMGGAWALTDADASGELVSYQDDPYIISV